MDIFSADDGHSERQCNATFDVLGSTSRLSRVILSGNSQLGTKTEVHIFFHELIMARVCAHRSAKSERKCLGSNWHRAISGAMHLGRIGIIKDNCFSPITSSNANFGD